MSGSEHEGATLHHAIDSMIGRQRETTPRRGLLSAVSFPDLHPLLCTLHDNKGSVHHLPYHIPFTRTLALFTTYPTAYPSREQWQSLPLTLPHTLHDNYGSFYQLCQGFGEETRTRGTKTENVSRTCQAHSVWLQGRQNKDHGDKVDGRWRDP